MKTWDTVAIVGVGLIGGSIGLALRKNRLAKQVVGIGRRTASLRNAKRCETVDATTTSLAKGVADAELVVVCTPVGDIANHVRQAAANCPAGSLITDAGSTKEQIVAALDGNLPDGINFVGSHPLAGSEKTGPQFAQADLFQDRTVVVTPSRRSRQQAVAGIEQFWQALGASVIHMTPRAHDEAVAAISHFPHLLASALAGMTAEKHLPLASTGWSDTTRVASGDPALWQQIFSSNPAPILRSLAKFERVLASFRAALERDDTEAIVKLLEAGKRHRDVVGN